MVTFLEIPGWHRSWSHGLWLHALHQALCWQWFSLFLPFSLPLLCSCTLSLAKQRNIYFKKRKTENGNMLKTWISFIYELHIYWKNLLVLASVPVLAFRWVHLGACHGRSYSRWCKYDSKLGGHIYIQRIYSVCGENRQEGREWIIHCFAVLTTRLSHTGSDGLWPGSLERQVQKQWYADR